MKYKNEPSIHKTLSRAILAIIIVVCLPTLLLAQAWKWIAYGDTRSNDDKHRAVLQSIMNNTPDYKFILNVGDVVGDGSNTSHWETWQNACNDVLGGTGQQATPPKYMSTPGNHDRTGQSSGLANWLKYLPGQAQQFGNDGVFFVFDYQNARFIILDSISSSLTGEQYTMMMDALQKNPKTWLFVFWHKPIFDFGPKSYESKIHQTWGPPLYQYGCDIMFMGHAHHYVRTKKLGLNGDKNPPLDPDKGVVQVITGNGGASSKSVNPDNDGNGYMTESYTSEYGYCELNVDGNSLRLRHYLADGTLFDEKFYTPNPKTGTPVEVGPATQIAMISGNNQTATVGTTLPNPFVVEVQDANNNPVSGVEVNFQIAFGNGTLSNSQPRTTAANGRAETTLTLGDVAETVTVTATSSGLTGSPQLFVATAITNVQDTDPPAPPTSVRVIVGGNQN